MASNKITYAFIAIDQFSKTANKIAKSIKNVQNSVNKCTEKVAKSTQQTSEKLKFSSSKMNQGLESVNQHLGRLRKNTNQTQSALISFGKNLAAIGEPGKGLVNFGDRIAKLSDLFGMGAYYRFMNIALPMTLVAKLGLDYADSLERSNIQMNALFENTKSYATYRKKIDQEASKYAMSGRFSRADIMGAVSTAAMMTHNIKTSQQLIAPAMKYAIVTGQTKDLSAAMSKLIKDAISGKAADLGLATIPGGIPAQRLQYLMKYINGRYGKVLAEDNETASAQMMIFYHALQKVAGTIMGMLAPAFAVYSRWVQKIVPPLNAFIKRHQELVKVIGALSIAAFIFLGVLMALGAIIGIIAMPFEIFSGSVKFLNAAWKIMILVGTELKAILIALRAPMLLLDAVMDANPIGLVVGAVILLIGALYGLYKALPYVWKGFKSVLNWVWNKLTAVIGKIKELKDTLMGLYHKGEMAFKSGYHQTMSGFHKFEHSLQVNLNVSDPHKTVSSVHVASSPSVHPKVNLGQNLAHT